MGLPEQELTAAEQLAWLDKDAGMQVFRVASSWYTRKQWGQPYRRHPSLRAAISFAMTNREMLDAAEKWSRRGLCAAAVGRRMKWGA